jgi:hypothetical protein
MDKLNLTGEEIFRTITAYTSEPLEVEFKAKINKKMFVDMIMTFEPEDMTLEQTSNAIYNISNNTNLIISKSYIDGKITKYTKQRIMYGRLEDFPNMAVSISLEKPLVQTPVAHESGLGQPLYRIKNRLSFIRGDWRYDFTQTIQMDAKENTISRGAIQSLALNLFSNINSSKNIMEAYIKSCNNRVINEFELEIELINKLTSKHLTSHSFLNSLKKNKTEIKNILYYSLVLQSIVDALRIKTRKGGISIKSILPSAETLTRVEYNRIFPPIGYYISYKADGERALLLSLKCGTAFMVTDKLEQINNFDMHHSGGMFTPVNILEGELLRDEGDFLAYDILMFNGADITHQRFVDRIPKIAECAMLLSKQQLPIKVLAKRYYLITEELQKSFKSVLEDRFPYPYDGFIMTSPDLDYYHTQNRKIKQHNTIDFLAVKLPAKLYTKFPIENSLLDKSVVYLLFCGTNEATIANMGMSKINHYSEIFGRRNFRDRIPIQFAPSDNPTAYIWYANKADDKKLTEYTESKNDGKGSWVIVELNLVKVHQRHVDWELIKIRDDRYNEPNYFGNDFTRVAVVNWLVSQDPLQLEQMHIGVSTYFGKGKNDYYFAQTSAMSFAKSKIMDEAFRIIKSNSALPDSKSALPDSKSALPDSKSALPDSKSALPDSKSALPDSKSALPDSKSGNTELRGLRVLDCAAGKGQDLNRYINAGVTHLLAMDIDKVALSELVTRYYDRVHDRRKTLNMQINIIPQDFTEPNKVITEKVKNIWKIDGEFAYPNMIVCNLAMHYFIKDLPELVNFVSFVKSMLPVGSIFMYTTFNGKKVFNLLAANGGDWNVQSEGAVRYRILRKYTNDDFADFGQTIQVKLPFTGDMMYEENLVNNTFVNARFAQYGIKPIKEGFMDEFLPGLQAENPQVFNALSDDDKKFIGLYYYCILKV